MDDIFWAFDLNTIPYAQAWELQKTLARRIQKRELPEILLLLEHPHVITLGRHGRKENILLQPDELRKQGVDFFQVDRGGDVTYHGPGQLVAYFLFRLEKSGVRIFVRRLERVIQAVLDDFGLKGETKEGKAGIWIKGRKICSIGIAVHESVSQHGLALNVHTDLSFFSLIHPCGDPDLFLTSMTQEARRTFPMSAIKERLIQQAQAFFLRKAVVVDKKELSGLAAG